MHGPTLAILKGLPKKKVVATRYLRHFVPMHGPTWAILKGLPKKKTRSDEKSKTFHFLAWANFGNPKRFAKEKDSK
jgi:hypothetical protein